MKYPCQSEYDSVYDGIELEMHIVDHCNLNCAGCNHFCPLAEPFYISLKDFQNQLELVKEKLPSLKWLMLLGGEPTLHPQLLELCKIARNIFPHITIEILTNGKDLSNVIPQLEQFKIFNIRFTIAQYNILYNENDIKALCSVPGNTFSWGRESFLQTLVDINGTQDMEKNFFYHCHHQLPCFTLQDYKIFECPFAAHIRHFIKKFNSNIPLIENVDYLDLLTITLDKLEKFSYQPKNICKYCKPGEHWTWHLSDNSFNEYTQNMQELYFTDYKKYEYIKLLELKKINQTVSVSVDPNFGLDIVKTNNIRFNGKIDIIIPYYRISDEQLDTLYNSLLKQTIINDCMIYFISDNSPNEQKVLNRFYNCTNLHSIFLKNEMRQGPGAARNKGIEYSSNKYLYFLDSDDYFFDPQSLEQLYNLISTTNYDIVTAYRQNEYKQQLLQFDYICSRDFLNTHNIRFGEYYIHEDLLFLYQLELNQANIFYSSFNGIIYNQHNLYSLSSSASTEEAVLSKYFTLYKLCQLSLVSNYDMSRIEFYLNFYADINNIELENTLKFKNNPELIENIYFILLKSVQLVQNKINLNHLNSILINLLHDSFIINNSIVTNHILLEQKVKQNFKKYNNNLFLKQIIIELERG